MGDGAPEGVRRIAEGIRRILDDTQSTDVVIALEGMAGKGTEVGRSFEELAALIEAIGEQRRIGVCLDTCHMNDAGYDVASFDDLLETFDKTVGLSRLKVLHVNDSKNPRGASKDRHENIGFGTLGFDVLHRAIVHPRLAGIPKILETPYVDDPADDKISYPPYRREIAMIRQGVFDPELKSKVLADKGR
jgi:deoxyribonuclease-4